MTNAWLQQQRKGALTEIADHVGLKNVERYKKIDLEVALEEHLRANSSKLSSDSKVAPFFYTVDPLSPTKQDPATGTVQTVEKERKPRARRQTLKAREELEGGDDAGSSAPTKTPNRALSFARSVPLPPSPAVLASQIDAHTTTFRSSISNYIADSRLPSTLDSVRGYLSTVTGIEILTLFVEAFGLRYEVLPFRYLTTLPAFPALGTSELPLKVPDFFALLTTAFWGPFGLWLLTSVLLPLLGGWFINLKGEGGYDAVSFNAVKAITAWVVYVRGGGPSASTRVVERGVPGGSTGMLVGAGAGALAGIYEAVLRK
ncbi:hypothetical protein HO133_002863 [Letharia lupina]|uniref:Uncharacterized protein n=1 Tax=Letharia lupina TaxID=560253 RepID=A0A8H6F9Z7_9LECA|nr:uncharacterized protein HO133_002863 [Letharia lupina]KAF6220431.1 hypothetical protein HO133_002863 [Letharia lupina]